MARDLEVTSTQYLVVTSAVVSTTPISMSAWVNLESTGANRAICGIGQASGWWSGSHYLSYENAANKFAATSTDGDNWVQSTYNATSTGVWAHVAGVWASTTSRLVYVNGAAGTSSTTSRNPSSLAKTTIGAYYYVGSPTSTWDGYVAEVAFWDAALDASEITALASGACPLLVRPGSIAAYYPLISNDNDLVGTYSMSAGGSPVFVSHGRIAYPRRRFRFGVPSGGAPPSSNLAWKLAGARPSLAGIGGLAG